MSIKYQATGFEITTFWFWVSSLTNRSGILPLIYSEMFASRDLCRLVQSYQVWPNDYGILIEYREVSFVESMPSLKSSI